jgi:hypothetical protein
MKYIFFILIYIVSTNINAQLKVRSDEFIQIGYDSYKTLSFGQETNIPNNGKYAIEYYGGGLNFWKPWPTAYMNNFILFLRDDNNIGMSTQGDQEYRLDVNGYVRAFNITKWSDKRLKTDIKPITNALEKICRLNGVSYKYNFSFPKYSDKNAAGTVKEKTMGNEPNIVSSNKPQLGFLAQDVQNIYPEIVMEDGKGFLGINYMDLIPVLTEAIKEQQTEIKELREKIAVLEKGLASKGDNVVSPIITCTPNPFNEVATLTFTLDSENASKATVVQIYDLKGALLKSYDVKPKVGVNSIDVNLSAFGTGIYYANLSVNGKTLSATAIISALK